MYTFVNEELFKEYRSYFPSPFPENSLLMTHPLLNEEWDYDKNYPLRPDNFSYGSGHKVWWLCPKGHSYDTVIARRTGKKLYRCPYCSNKRVGEDNNLLVVFPEIAKEWHPTKNKELTPKDFTPGSSEKVWWLCPIGHSYKSFIYSRTSPNPRGCHYCSGHKASEENNLLKMFPEIAKEWHPTKNKELTPEQVTYGSGKKVWWQCPKGHSYETVISYRTGRKWGCHYCSGNKVGEDNNLLAMFPEIAKEWHPTENGKLTPKQVTPGINKKVWWLCPEGHSYESRINGRTDRRHKRGCPYCSGLRTLNYDLFK